MIKFQDFLIYRGIPLFGISLYIYEPYYASCSVATSDGELGFFLSGWIRGEEEEEEGKGV